MQIKPLDILAYTSCKYPLIKQKNEKDLFSKFKTGDVFLSLNETDKKKSSKNAKAIVGALLFMGGAIACILKRKSIKKILNLSNNQPVQDLLYRKNIALAIGLNEDEVEKISSILGPEEFCKFIKDMEKTPEVYSAGTPVFVKNFSIEKFLNENLQNCDFGANLHLHSNNSDGKMSVVEILDKAVQYADKRAQKNRAPFVLAITDHDSVEGCKEAVRIIANEPDKYKNLKVVLGCENTFVYSNSELLKNDIKVHMLSYAINPFDEQFDSFLLNRIKRHNEDMQGVLTKAKQKYFNTESKIELSLDDMKKISPSIVTSLRDTTYYMKDYLQFKTIFSKVLSNRRLKQKLQNSKINVSDIDYAKAIELIPKNPDYSNGKKYYEYYHQALKKYILGLLQEKNVQVSEDETRKIFTELNDDMNAFLQKIESETLTPNADLYVKPVEYLSFQDGLTKFSNFKDGILSMAHPTVFYPINSLKNQQNMLELYEVLYSDFVKFAPKKAVASENFYQSYYQNADMGVIEKIKNISARYNLLSTGGLDTHGREIFSV